MLQSLNMVHFHLTLSLRAHELKFGISVFPTVWYVDDFQGGVDFHGHNLWYVCKSVPSIPNFITKTCFQEGFAHHEAEENSHSRCPKKQSWRWGGKGKFQEITKANMRESITVHERTSHPSNIKTLK